MISEKEESYNEKYSESQLLSLKFNCGFLQYALECFEIGEPPLSKEDWIENHRIEIENSDLDELLTERVVRFVAFGLGTLVFNTNFIPLDKINYLMRTGIGFDTPLLYQLWNIAKYSQEQIKTTERLNDLFYSKVPFETP